MQRPRTHSLTLLLSGSLSDSVVVDFNAFCLTLLFVVALNYMPFLGAGLLDVKRPPPKHLKPQTRAGDPAAAQLFAQDAPQLQ